MIKTYGLTHIALTVKDVERSLRFYSEVLGVVPVYREKDFIQAQTPGSHDVIVFLRGTKSAGKSGGIGHFGFRLVSGNDITAAARAVEQAGGRNLRQEEFGPGEPSLFFADPDGYEVQIWYELPTSADPK